MRLNGEEDEYTFIAANNYATSLVSLQHFKEAKSLLRKRMPVMRRVHGEDRRLTLKMRWTYAQSLYEDPSATLDDLRKAVTMLEETAPTARRVLGSAHPTTEGIEETLQCARAVLRARELSNS